MYALVILFRFEWFKWLQNTYKFEVDINTNAAIACLLIGLSVRVFASMVPSLPVDTHTKSHYLSAGLTFISIGTYMIIETFIIDQDCWPILKAAKWIMVARRLTCCVYWFAFILTGVFMELELW
eukprot:237430_1